MFIQFIIVFREIRFIFAKIQEAGLNMFWRNYGYDIDKTNETYGTKILQEIYDNPVLRLEHLQSSFMIFGFGCIIATLCFILEIISKKYKK